MIYQYSRPVRIHEFAISSIREINCHMLVKFIFVKRTILKFLEIKIVTWVLNQSDLKKYPCCELSSIDKDNK